MNKLVSMIFTVAVLVSASASLHGEFCISLAASYSGNWKSAASAPRDGTPVELLETYGVAPTYGLFRWTKEATAIYPNGTLVHYRSKDAEWESVDRPGIIQSESNCMYWRPYKGDPSKYVDPTGGAQDTVAYWCTALHLKYDKKKDVCVPRKKE